METTAAPEVHALHRHGDGLSRAGWYVAAFGLVAVAVVLATTEPELALAHADRILVFHRGRVSAEFSGQAVDRAALMRHA